MSPLRTDAVVRTLASTFHLLPEQNPGLPGSLLEIPRLVSAWSSASGSLAPLPTGPCLSAIYLEPVLHENRPRLLLVDLEGHDIRVNDQKMPCVTLLDIGDQVRIDQVPPLEVALYHRARVGPPASETIGVACPVCLIQFGEESRVYECPVCGLALHWELDGEDPLQCALAASGCPRCGTAIHQSDSYHIQPEFLPR